MAADTSIGMSTTQFSVNSFPNMSDMIISYLDNDHNNNNNNINNNNLTMLQSSTTVHPEVALSLRQTRFAVQTVLTPVVVIIGLLGNILNILVLLQPSMRSSTNVYILVLSLADSIYLVFNFALSILDCRKRDLSDSAYYFNPYGRFVSNFSGNVAVWVTVGFTVERYIAVCHPMRGKRWCTVSRAKLASLAIVILSLINTLPTIFELEVVGTDSGLRCQYTDLANQFSYEMVYSWWYVTVFTFIPLICLAIFNIVLIRVLLDANRKRQELVMISSTRKTSKNRVKQPLFTTNANSSSSSTTTNKGGSNQNPIHSNVRSNCSNNNISSTRANFSSSHKNKTRFNMASSASFHNGLTPTNHRPTLQDATNHLSSSSLSSSFAHDSSNHASSASSQPCLSSISKCQYQQQPHQKQCHQQHQQQPQPQQQQQQQQQQYQSLKRDENISYNNNTNNVNTNNSKQSSLRSSMGNTSNRSNVSAYMVAVGNGKDGGGGGTSPKSKGDNSSSYSTVKRQGKRMSREQNKVTLLLVTIVMIFFLCQLPWTALFLYKTYLSNNNLRGNPTHNKIAGNICNLLGLMNASCNFYLYSCFSKRFRKTFKSLVLFWRKKSNIFTTIV